MFCKSCGRQIDNDSTFCSFCGTKQSTDLKTQVQAYTNQSINTTQKVYSNETNFNNTTNIVHQPKYDPTYKKEDDAITVGIILLVITLIFAIVGPIKFEDKESYVQSLAVTAIVSLILRICVTIWAVNIAKRQNRETFGWGLFAFFLPSIALIVIAKRKKLFANIQIVEGLDNEQNSKILSDKAQEFYNEKKYSESIRFSEKAIELNSNNEIAKEIKKKSKAAKGNIVNSYQTEIFETDENIELKIVSNFNTKIGADAFINNLTATDGVYITHEKGMLISREIVIKNGKVIRFITNRRCKNLKIQMGQNTFPVKGDLVFLDNGDPAPTGIYKQGFLETIVVEDGKFIDWNYSRQSHS
jgi:hypothetical protein